MRYGYTKAVTRDFAEVVRRTKEELGKAGFGVMFDIDMQATLRQKIGVEFDRYVIIGACNPPLAHEALSAEREIGLLLPCNVIVYEKDGAVFVSAVVPTVAMQGIDNERVKAVAVEAEKRLKNVIDAI